jgi:tetratricopeptide (TPR) repeat protein
MILNLSFLGRRAITAILLVLLTGILVYANIFQVPFVLDDYYTIVRNPVIRNLANFSFNSALDQIYLPRVLTFLTFALNYHFGGLNVTGYHLANLLIHLASGLLVYALLRLTFRTPYFKDGEVSDPGFTPQFIALFAALLFIVHPVQTQAVTYVVQRMTSLAAMLYLLSGVLYVKGRLGMEEGKGKFSYRPALFLAGSVLAAVMAMQTKEIAFTLPLAMVLYEVCFFRGAWRRRFLCLLPLLATLPIVPVTVLVTGRSSGHVLADLSEKTLAVGNLSRLEYLFTQFRVIVTYLRLLVFPVNQNLDYDYPVYSTFFTPPVFLSFLLLLLLLGFAVYLWHRSTCPASQGQVQGGKKVEVEKKSGLAEKYSQPEPQPKLQSYPHPVFPSTCRPYLRLIAFGIFWFFLTLAVESSIVPIADVIAEHRLYLPSVGAAAAFAAAFGLLVRKCTRPACGKVLVLGAALLVLVLGFAGHQRNRVWGDAIRLWQDVVSKSPNKARPYNDLGIALTQAGQLPEAIEVLSRAIALKPLHPYAYNNLGRLYILSNRSGDAVPLLKRAIGLDTDFADAYINLAAAYNQLRQFSQTVTLMEQNLGRLDRLNERVEAHYQLGVAYAFLGNREGARRKLDLVSRAGATDLAADLVRLLGRGGVRPAPP